MPIRKFAWKVNIHEKSILTYCEYHIANGVDETMNNNIKNVNVIV
ncbi:MAG: transposase [Bacteroidales bacterium]|nr:transposase [Bacteroidales bacterium]